MQENEQHYGRESFMHRSANPQRKNVPPMTGFARAAAAESQYQGHLERGADRAISQRKQSSRWKNFNWQFLVFWTAYAALIFGIGYALI